MWNVELVNNAGIVIDSFSIDDDEVTVDDIAQKNWILSDGDSIVINKDE